jgi:hypothetical protein
MIANMNHTQQKVRDDMKAQNTDKILEAFAKQIQNNGRCNECMLQEHCISRGDYALCESIHNTKQAILKEYGN